MGNARKKQYQVQSWNDLHPLCVARIEKAKAYRYPNQINFVSHSIKHKVEEAKEHYDNGAV